MGPQARIIAGERLHLHHGPIDLIIGADGDRAAAFRAASVRFATVLDELVSELSDLRAKMQSGTEAPKGETALRMHQAALPHAATFVTRMAAVAGAVAETVLAAMAQTAITRAYVNNGGDIALHLTPGTQFDLGLAGLDGTAFGRVCLNAGSPVRGIATSGFGGRSLTRGIATSVTVLAQTAAQADVAATLIANAVDLPGHTSITRAPAQDLQPDSDLGTQEVVTHVGNLTLAEVLTALAAGAQTAKTMQENGHIIAAALFLRGKSRIIGPTAAFDMPPIRSLSHA